MNRKPLMNDEQRQFLSLLSQPPARFTVEQTAWALNFQPHDIPRLVAARLLKPLGNPAKNGFKTFPAHEILALARDTAWLSKATSTIHKGWEEKNNRRGGGKGTSQS